MGNSAKNAGGDLQVENPEGIPPARLSDRG